MFRALVVSKDGDGKTSAEIRDASDSELPPGDVTVAVEYSTVNYKDGLCLSATGGGLVRSYPHVPGIDFAGAVESSNDPRFAPGTKVILTGWRVGEASWGGFASRARVKGDWLVPLPSNMTTRSAMAVGTAGLTAMLALQALEKHGLRPDSGEVLVTGASGGVGSVALALLSALGYRTAAVTGRPDLESYLTDMGAGRIVVRSELSQPVARPLEKETWAGCIDAVGGTMLARILGQMKYGSSVAAVGLAGGAALPASVVPFLLRGVNLLGIDSVLHPIVSRKEAWNRIAAELPIDKLERFSRTVCLGDVTKYGRAILAGQVCGRIVVDVNA